MLFIDSGRPYHPQLPFLAVGGRPHRWRGAHIHGLRYLVVPSRVVFRAVVHFVLLIRVFPLSLNIPRLRRHKFFPRFIFYCARARPFHSACPNDIFRLTAAFHQSLGFGPSFPFLLFFCQIQANQFLLRFFYVLSIFILYCLFIFYIELRRCLSRSRAILHVENWNFGAFFLSSRLVFFIFGFYVYLSGGGYPA